jgi:hypothetical protein
MKVAKITFLATLGALVFTPANRAANLVENGRPVAVIGRPSGPDANEKLAEADLANCVEKMSGATFP